LKGKKEENAKQRIFKSALSLFARKGFAATSIRRIAKKANVNISMINYYFGGKIGILKYIINDAYDKYYSAMRLVLEEKTGSEDLVKNIIDNIIRFFRENTEIAIVALDVIPLDMPRIADLKSKWISENRRVMDRFFIRLGLNTNEDVEMSVFRGALTSIILSHFQSKYVKENMDQISGKFKSSTGNKAKKMYPLHEDLFYDRYSKTLSKLYLHGVKSIGKKVKT